MKRVKKYTSSLARYKFKKRSRARRSFVHRSRGKRR